MEVITDAGHGVEAKQIALALGLGDSAAKMEGLRGKLRRLVARTEYGAARSASSARNATPPGRLNSNPSAAPFAISAID